MHPHLTDVVFQTLGDDVGHSLGVLVSEHGELIDDRLGVEGQLEQLVGVEAPKDIRIRC